jgi:hypothetical protein
MGVALPALLTRDPLMIAVATTALVAVIGTSAFIVAVTGQRRHEAAETRIDCTRILRMIDDAFDDHRLSSVETSAIERTSMAMRASATPANAREVARCVGLPGNGSDDTSSPTVH